MRHNHDQIKALRISVGVCNPILVMTFPEWLSYTEPWPHAPGAVGLSSSCLRAHAQFFQFDKADATTEVQ